MEDLTPRMLWNEKTILGAACMAYNAEMKKHRLVASSWSQQVFAMKAALMAAGLGDCLLDPTTCRRNANPPE